jgi:uncharacterized membrane protein
MKFILLILTTLLISVSCFSQKSVTQRVKEIYTAIQKGKIKPIFIASQYEPFWDIYIMGNYAIFHSDSGMSYDYFTVLENFDKSKYSQVLHLKDGSGNISTLKIIKKQTDDGMSDRLYPYTIVYSGFKFSGHGRLNLKF